MLGNGDSTLIKTENNKIILIDTGNGINNTVTKYLLARNIKKINYLLISHFDLDHCGGVKDLFGKIKIEKIIISKQPKETEELTNILNLAKKYNTNVIQVFQGDNIIISKNTQINILYPEKNLKYNDLNNNSIVVKISYNNFSMLLTGDIEDSEKELIKKYGKKLQANILKISHHGATETTSEEFLKKVNPEIALIGVGKNNTYGHPEEKILNRLKIFGTQIYRTDINGEIKIIVNKKGKKKVYTKL